MAIVPDIAGVSPLDNQIQPKRQQPLYNDINLDISPRNTGVGRPTLATFIGNIQELRFAVNDFADTTPTELLHGWKEGTPIEFHIHWAMGAANDATARGVKWEIEYALGGVDNPFTTSVVASKETVIAPNEVARLHKYTSVCTLDTTGSKIGTQLLLRVRRIAADGVAPATDPFILSFGIHYEVDTLGSEEITRKL